MPRRRISRPHFRRISSDQLTQPCSLKPQELTGALVGREAQVIQAEHDHARGKMGRIEGGLPGEGEIRHPIFHFGPQVRPPSVFRLHLEVQRRNAAFRFHAGARRVFHNIHRFPQGVYLCVTRNYRMSSCSVRIIVSYELKATVSCPRTQPPREFLLTASRNTLRSYELSRLGHAANLRKEISSLLDQWLDENANAMVARWLIEQRERSVRAARESGGELAPGTTIPVPCNGQSVSDNLLADRAARRNGSRSRG